jgi:hypothetical protein
VARETVVPSSDPANVLTLNREKMKRLPTVWLGTHAAGAQLKVVVNVPVARISAPAAAALDWPIVTKPAIRRIKATVIVL